MLGQGRGQGLCPAVYRLENRRPAIVAGDMLQGEIYKQALAGKIGQVHAPAPLGYHIAPAYAACGVPG